MNGTSSAPGAKWRCSCGGCGCGCCEGIKVLTPESTVNRPGLSALRYRIGTHGSFLATMKARLSSHELPAPGDAGPNGMPTRPLARLRTRDASDPAIALLDAWAMVADVLTFYQERIANEGYLRTAVEMRSLFEMSRLIGYRPRPGVASSVYLAYTIDANTTQEIVVPQGARAQTVPAQDQLPQSFETSEDLKARAAWNRLGLRKTEPQQWLDVQRHFAIYFEGTQTGLTAGDPLLIDRGMPDRPPLPYRVLTVDADANANRTTVTFELWNRAGLVQDMVARLLASAPSGPTADKVKDALRKLGASEADDSEFDAMLGRLRMLIPASLAGLDIERAKNLAPWLAEVANSLDDLPAPTPAAWLAASGTDSQRIEDRIGRLIAPPSKPLTNALRLPRSLGSSFDPIGDANLKVLGAAAPALKDTLAPALTGFLAAAPPQPMRVWALRLHAGLFGRAFPRPTRTETTAKDAPNDGNEQGRPVTTTRTVDDGEWPIVTVAGTGANKTLMASEEADMIYLDASREGVAPGSWVFIDASAVPVVPDKQALVVPVQSLLVAPVRAVYPKLSRAAYGASGDTTAVRLGSATKAVQWLRFTVKKPEELNNRDKSTSEHDFAIVRRTAVYAQTLELPLAERPIDKPLCGGASGTGSPSANVSVATDARDANEPVELDGLYADLEPGRFLIVSGERADVGATRGVFASEPVMITSVVHDVRAAGTRSGPWTRVNDAMRAAAPARADGNEPAAVPKLPGDRNHTFIWFDKPLAYCYQRESVAILGNVVKATHGETRVETLGNGDGSKPLQRFDLKQAPLTWLPAPSAAGAESTAKVYVDDVRWHEAPDFVGQGVGDRVYLIQIDDQGKTSVQFGDGRTGARLPTGIGNVKAVYRNGIGRPGNAAAGQIQQLVTRPLGVKEVTNPLRASGGADRENLDQIRRNAPLAVKSLDRLVSVPDYADFACTFAGIARADAQELSDGRRSMLHLTVAGIDDIPIDIDSELLINLRRALRDLGDPFQPLAVEPRELRMLIISAKLRICADYLWEPVVTQVRSALLDAFGFDRRELAQGVASSEVLSVAQRVRGVDFVDLDAFGAINTVVVDGGKRRPLTPAETAAAVAQVVSQGVSPAAVQSSRARRSPDGLTILPTQLVLLSGDVAETLVLNQMV